MGEKTDFDEEDLEDFKGPFEALPVTVYIKNYLAQGLSLYPEIVYIKSTDVKSLIEDLRGL